MDGMEKLNTIDRTGVSESSLEEDILGEQGLLMCESDSEGRTKEIDMSEDATKPINVAIRSEFDNDDKPEDSVASNESFIQKSKSKLSSLMDSESEEERTEGGGKSADVEQGRSRKSENISKKARVRVLMSSDSENETKNSERPRKQTTKPRRPELESDDEAIPNEQIERITNISTLVDTDSEEEHRSGDNSEMEMNVAPDGSAALEHNSDVELPKAGRSKSKTIRASAKRAIDEMHAIQSEQQRLHREAHVSVPYHKPKKHTLEEFLKRRTIIKPQMTDESSNCAASVVQTKRLKMTKEELEEYAKLMEERAREATEFFKSESEEDEGELKDNEGVLDKAPVVEGSINVNPIENESNGDEDNVIENVGGVQLTAAELEEILLEDKHGSLPTSKVLITEVIELPKLDMSTMTGSCAGEAEVSTPVRKLTETVRELLTEKNLPASPSLSGDPNKLIDLETGDLIEKRPSGIESLMQRLISSCKARKSKSSETCSILSTENGKLEMSKVNVSVTEDNDRNKEHKPRSAYFKLKENLKSLINKKRLEDMHRKYEGEIGSKKCLKDESIEEDDIDGREGYGTESKPEDFDILVDDEENPLNIIDDEELVVEEQESGENVENDATGTDNDGNDDVKAEEESDDEDDESRDKDGVTKRKSRIIKAFDDSDNDDDDDRDFLKTQPQSTNQPQVFETQLPLAKPSSLVEENELMVLDSGKFDVIPKHSTALMSQIPITHNNEEHMDAVELIELCSGSFDQGPFETIKNDCNDQIVDGGQGLSKGNKFLFLSSDDEDDEEEDEEERIDSSLEKQRIKKLTKKRKRKRTKLGFSDDEEEEEEEEEEDNINFPDEDIEVVDKGTEEMPETYVDYDSEENEIVVHMSKKDCVKQAEKFVENEAELSDSEWGSADEDERNLDKYDIELGDEDEFDREKLQSELGQIHARKMLDQDIKELRQIQEMLFEDEEKDGVGRQRQFKWKNVERGFSLDGGEHTENADGVKDGSDDVEAEEHLWRKIRYEREQLLKEQGLKASSQDTSTTLPSKTVALSNVTKICGTVKKIQVITNKQNSTNKDHIGVKSSSPFLISCGISTVHKKTTRGSFLDRDRETLSKLVGITKGGANSIASGTGSLNDLDVTAGTKSIRSKNFVFATLTEEEHENLKRKADDLLNSSNEGSINFMKKPKKEPRRDRCFIDQLL